MYAEIAYFTAQPVAHLVAYEQHARQRMVDNRNREALQAIERRARRP